jgi:7,8-dihydro-6-hydroxymethylpterin-pyrophosphokinase
VYLGLGSNLGDREANLREATERIKGLALEIVRASSIYETEPVDYTDQPWFLNQVVEVRVDLNLTFNDDPNAELLRPMREKDPGLAASFWICGFLKALQHIEREMGRERSMVGGPRVIDIDILLFGEMDCFFVKTHVDKLARAERPFLILPHPRMHERRFVLEPLCEIAPEVVHPTFKRTCVDLLCELDDKSEVRLYRMGES